MEVISTEELLEENARLYDELQNAYAHHEILQGIIDKQTQKHGEFECKYLRMVDVLKLSGNQQIEEHKEEKKQIHRELINLERALYAINTDSDAAVQARLILSDALYKRNWPT